MAKMRVAYEYTEAEDKSIRLGLLLIISGITSLFIFGFCWLSPALQDLQAKAANCTVLSVQLIGEAFQCTFTCGTDCRGTAHYPCLQVFVNNSHSNSRALLHRDEHQLLTNPKTRRRAPQADSRRHRPPALLPLARGGLPGGSPHCAADHLYQDPGRQSGGHEEAQILLGGNDPPVWDSEPRWGRDRVRGALVWGSLLGAFRPAGPRKVSGAGDRPETPGDGALWDAH
ncbi:calcium-activated potassium channel subunit beta-4 isoform X1 [Tachyglossus aculeatus]|uniref:calcium-activated potassium channel subunit beta-4 isoform X1 n=1 Tax=Tachyglossus aculeatus TaxID=9261 RepID=UPI0018F38853|nr:calcium-activated potassium channel subunit beta-4 isoform X1 [Tachyglossus aculeatus]